MSSLPQPPGTAAELGLAYGAGALTVMIVIPISVITTRQQTSPPHERKSMVGTAKEVIQGDDGMRGLWKGLSAAWILCINPGITYGAIERLRGLLFQGREDLRPWESSCECRTWNVEATKASDVLTFASQYLA